MEVSSISTNNSVQRSSLFIKRQKKESLNATKELNKESKKSSKTKQDKKVSENASNPKKNASKKEKKARRERKSPGVSVIENIRESSPNNSDLVIEIDEDYDPKKKKRPSSLKPEKKNFKPKSQYLQGYNPFIFYEKEKCYNIDFSKINARDYIKEISYQWKTMTEEEKEPYVKLAIDFKKNSENTPEDEKMLNKKRKRNNIKDANKKKKKKIKKKELHKSLSESLKSIGFAGSNSSSKRNKSETKIKTMKLEKDDCDDDVKSYINSVLIPFVKKSYNYFMKKGMKLK